MCQDSADVSDHIEIGLWHGGFVRLVKDIGCNLVDGSTGDLTTEDLERIQLHNVLYYKLESYWNSVVLHTEQCGNTLISVVSM